MRDANRLSTESWELHPGGNRRCNTMCKIRRGRWIRRGVSCAEASRQGGSPYVATVPKSCVSRLPLAPNESVSKAIGSWRAVNTRLGDTSQPRHMSQHKRPSMHGRMHAGTRPTHSLTELRVFDNSFDADPHAGVSPADPHSSISAEGKILNTVELSKTPHWAKALAITHDYSYCRLGVCILLSPRSPLEGRPANPAYSSAQSIRFWASS
jgi:hypothetical protein